MIGRSLRLLIASTTRWLNALPLVLTPIRTVGFSVSIVFTRSFEGAALCAYTFCASDRLARDGSSSPSMSNKEMRLRASRWDSPLACMALEIKLPMPIPAKGLSQREARSRLHFSHIDRLHLIPSPPVIPLYLK